MTRLLCKYDPLNAINLPAINIHKYIDNVPCILALGKLKNGQVVAGFSISPFVSGCVGTDALIMGVSKKLVFYPKKNVPRTIAYDDFFIIFGNSDLRFKSNNLGVFSNLGVNNGYFDAKGNNASALFD